MFFRSKTSTQRIGRAETKRCSPKTAIVVFDVGEANLRISRKHCADLVILREPEGRVEIFVVRHRRTEKIKGCLHPEGISYEFDLPLHG